MTITVHGAVSREATKDEDGNRRYRATYHVESSDLQDGPERVINDSTGLPQVGDPWDLGNDYDGGVFRSPVYEVRPYDRDGGNHHWLVTFTWSNGLEITACEDVNVTNPLMQPARVSGGNIQKLITQYKDADGNAIKTTSFEPVGVERTVNLPTITIEANVPYINVASLAYGVGKTNLYALWGMPVGTIEFSNYAWRRRFWGQCMAYFVLTMEFTLDYTGSVFKRSEIPNVGKKVIRGDWTNSGGTFTYTPDVNAVPSNPGDYVAATDTLGNPITVGLNPTTGGVATGSEFLPEVTLASGVDLSLLSVPVDVTAPRTTSGTPTIEAG